MTEPLAYKFLVYCDFSQRAGKRPGGLFISEGLDSEKNKILRVKTLCGSPLLTRNNITLHNLNKQIQVHKYHISFVISYVQSNVFDYY